MKFPDVLTVQALDGDTSATVSDVAIVLFLTTLRKNRYCVGPKITDIAGRAKFSRSDCEQAIASAQKMFLMDYVGDLSSCAPVAEIRLHPADRVAVMIRNYESHPEFWGLPFEDAPALFEALKKVDNSAFASGETTFRDSEILSNPNISIILKRR
jgi:hypothetical protein